MKTVWRINFRLGFIALLILNSGSLLCAETPARSRGTTIIFSAPKADTVSSNLNELRTPSSPFLEMESNLKKPFDLFDSGKPSGGYYPVVRPQPPQPDVKRKSYKDVLNERAEEIFLEPKLHQGETDDDLYKFDDGALDPYGRKSKSSIDRYYDRMDRALTNRPASSALDSTGLDSKDPLNRNNLNPFATPAAPDITRRSTDNRLRPFGSPNNAMTAPENIFGDRSLLDQNDRNSANRPNSSFSNAREPKETRLENFKRLLESPSPSRAGSPMQSGNYGITPARSSAAPAAARTSYNGYKPASSAAPVNSFSKSAGLVGAPANPQGLPDYAAPSLNSGTPLPTAKPTPPSTFQIPKRRF
ncbi:MAG: hypothetical protein AAB370_00640 [Verrucomicrobiota bacterium]